MARIKETLTPSETVDPIIATTALLNEVVTRANAEAAKAEREAAETLTPILARVDAIAAEVEQAIPEERLAELHGLQAVLARPDMPYTPTLHTLKGKVGEVVGIRSGIKQQVEKLHADAARPPATVEHRLRWQQEMTEKARQLWGAPAAVQRLLDEITHLCASLNAKGANAIVPVAAVIAPPERLPAADHYVTSNYVPLAKDR